MNHDIFQSVPQGDIGAQDAENSRIKAIADELRRRCELYEAQRRDSQPHVSLFEAEQRVTEMYAKEHGLWLPMENVFDLGIPGPGVCVSFLFDVRWHTPVLMEFRLYY